MFFSAVGVVFVRLRCFSCAYVFCFLVCFILMYDVCGMGVCNAICERSLHFTSSAVIKRACEIYVDQFGDYEGLSKATFEIITMTGWVENNAK